MCLHFYDLYRDSLPFLFGAGISELSETLPPGLYEADKTKDVICEDTTPKAGPMSPEGTQERNKEDWPTAEVPIKAVIPGSPDIYIFP